MVVPNLRQIGDELRCLQHETSGGKRDGAGGEEKDQSWPAGYRTETAHSNAGLRVQGSKFFAKAKGFFKFNGWIKLVLFI